MKVIEVPFTIAPLLGVDKVGAEGIEIVGSVSQANPEASNIHKSNTMVILGNFILCLQLIPGIFNRMFCSICVIVDYFVVVDLSMYVALYRAVHQLRKPRDGTALYSLCQL